MGLLDSVLGALGGADQGPQGDALQAVIAMLAEGRDGAEPGGLAGLVQHFEAGGLGELVASWIGTGRNLPVSAEQLRSLLGESRLGEFAQQLGLGQGEAAHTLAQLLPDVIDRLTPDGELPDMGTSGFGDLGSVLERFSKH